MIRTNMDIQRLEYLFHACNNAHGLDPMEQLECLVEIRRLRKGLYKVLEIATSGSLTNGYARDLMADELRKIESGESPAIDDQKGDKNEIA